MGEHKKTRPRVCRFIISAVARKLSLHEPYRCRVRCPSALPLMEIPAKAVGWGQPNLPPLADPPSAEHHRFMVPMRFRKNWRLPMTRRGEPQYCSRGVSLGRSSRFGYKGIGSWCRSEEHTSELQSPYV